MTVVIAGFGFVGKAHYHVFKEFDLYIVDPQYNSNKISDVENLEGVLCCVSTPQGANGECDYSNIVNVLEQVPESVPVLIKSTVSLQGWSYLKERFKNHSINYSPEFLRAATANQDMEWLKFLIMSNNTGWEYWITFYRRRFVDLEIFSCPIEEAIAIKYFENAFLATKLSFFNQIYDFCNVYSLNFEDVRTGLSMDERINGDHTLVDPSQGFRGWGGHCFPKDTSALLNMAKEKNLDLNILEAAVNYNRTIRKDNSNSLD
jgi:UDPglucose 6-dehydrogenase